MESLMNSKCSLCFHLYDPQTHIPKQLPCGHNFCRVCLNSSLEEGQVKCRQCKASCDVPGGNLDNLSTTFELLSVAMVKDMLCDVCASPKHVRCICCSSNFCDSCLQVHRQDSQIKDVLKHLDNIQTNIDHGLQMSVAIDRHNGEMEGRKVEISKVCDVLHKEISVLCFKLNSDLDNIIRQNTEIKGCLMNQFKEELVKNESLTRRAHQLSSVTDPAARAEALDVIQEECIKLEKIVELKKTFPPLINTCSLNVSNVSRLAELQLTQCKIPQYTNGGAQPSYTRSINRKPSAVGLRESISPPASFVKEQLASQRSTSPKVPPGMSRGYSIAVQPGMLPYHHHQQQAGLVQYAHQYGMLPTPRPLMAQVPQGQHYNYSYIPQPGVLPQMMNPLTDNRSSPIASQVYGVPLMVNIQQPKTVLNASTDETVHGKSGKKKVDDECDSVATPSSNGQVENSPALLTGNQQMPLRNVGMQVNHKVAVEDGHSPAVTGQSDTEEPEI